LKINLNYAVGIHKNNPVRRELNTSDITSLQPFNQRAISFSSTPFCRSHKLVLISTEVLGASVPN
jgi:hypothetical protein